MDTASLIERNTFQISEKANRFIKEHFITSVILFIKETLTPDGHDKYGPKIEIWDLYIMTLDEVKETCYHFQCENSQEYVFRNIFKKTEDYEYGFCVNVDETDDFKTEGLNISQIPRVSKKANRFLQKHFENDRIIFITEEFSNNGDVYIKDLYFLYYNNFALHRFHFMCVGDEYVNVNVVTPEDDKFFGENLTKSIMQIEPLTRGEDNDIAQGLQYMTRHAKIFILQNFKIEDILFISEYSSVVEENLYGPVSEKYEIFMTTTHNGEEQRHWYSCIDSYKGNVKYSLHNEYTPLMSNFLDQYFE